MQVIVRDNNVDQALKVLKKKMQQDNLFNELRRREFYESRGTKRRRERNAAIRRHKREEQKRKDQKENRRKYKELKPVSYTHLRAHET